MEDIDRKKNVMSKDLLGTIRQLNRQNHLSQSTEAARAQDDVSYAGILERVQTRLTGDLKERINGAVARFDAKMRDVQSGASNPDGLQQAIGDFTSVVGNLDRKLESLTTSSEPAPTPSPAVDPAPFAEQLASFEQAVVARLDRMNGVPDATIAELENAVSRLTNTILPALEQRTGTADDTGAQLDLSSSLAPVLEKLDGLEQLLSSAASDPASPNTVQGGASTSEIAELLDQQFEKLRTEFSNTTTAPAAIAGDASTKGGEPSESSIVPRLEAFERELIQRIESFAMQTASGSTVDVDQTIRSAIRETVNEIEREQDADDGLTDAVLLARLESLEEGVRASVEAFHAKTTQTVLDRCLELEHSIPNAIRSVTPPTEAPTTAMIAESAPAASSTPTEIVDVVRSLIEGNTLPDNMLELPDMVMNLRKDFSLLVHTINSHLEETRNLSQHIRQCVIEAMTELEEQREAPSIPALDEALASLSELQELPGRIRSEIHRALDASLDEARSVEAVIEVESDAELEEA